MSGSVDEPKDVIWQQRRGRTPSAHENAMGEALGQIFEEGVEDLGAIVQRLNDLGIASADGGKWTAESFQSEIASLGTKEF
jgi:hypothetical protein